MTVCVGIHCPDGVVIAADTQVTYVGSHKGYAPKIDYFGNDTFCVGGAGSGYFDVLNETFLYLKENLVDLRASSNRQVRDAIKRVLSSVVRKRPQEADSQFLLAAIAVRGKLSLTHFRRDIASELPMAVIGCGNTHLSEYLQSWVSKQPEDCSEGLHWATYITYKAKQFVDGCGGKTDAMVVGLDGKVDVKRRSLTRHYENYFAELEDEVFDLFGSMAIGRLTGSELGMSLKALTGRLERLHQPRDR
ncbi:MAG: hypothetical protein WBE13_12460 [Candidatus Acidiferrum sp.]